MVLAGVVLAGVVLAGVVLAGTCAAASAAAIVGPNIAMSDSALGVEAEESCWIWVTAPAGTSRPPITNVSPDGSSLTLDTTPVLEAPSASA